MAQPGQVNTSLQMGLFLVYFGYVAIANGVSILFAPSYIFEGDVLQAMPDTWISLLVRLLMIFVIAVTAPLIAIPCGELLEGKLGLDQFYKRILVRVLFWLVCIGFAEFMPVGFVHVVSFIGCFCVAMVGFVLPPLFCLQLSTQRKCRTVIHDSTVLCDIVAFVVGVVATSITSSLTFRELMMRISITQVAN